MKKARGAGGVETPGPDTECFSFLNLIDSTLKLQRSRSTWYSDSESTLWLYVLNLQRNDAHTPSNLTLGSVWVHSGQINRGKIPCLDTLVFTSTSNKSKKFLPISNLTSRFQNPRWDLTGSQKSQLWWKGTKIVKLFNSSMRPCTGLRQCYAIRGSTLGGNRAWLFPTSQTGFEQLCPISARFQWKCIVNIK